MRLKESEQASILHRILSELYPDRSDQIRGYLRNPDHFPLILLT